ncbi:SPFH domain-containing protein [Marinobacterium stanieri]|uniref:SPFH domain / Band 7 family protein n=1 Tax=Marinobacterium stanieri TaxID=49186 RepID=A0A1N6TXQ2_9GAMM|nr:SPFH domain-containing protein [Marinobacterium stanieri]SIQ58067.1 SPFH domain / Band 7 family protein [Marinobacterium stanieri]
MDEKPTVKFPSFNKVKVAVGAVLALIIGYVLSQSFFYAEPGYIYHVRTVTGNEAVVTEIGYKFYPFSRYNSWKRAMTVQAVSGSSQDAITSEKDANNASASLPPLSIMFLDQVDAHAQATVRFSIPSDEESFLKLAHEYRSPENLLRTALLPVFKETLQANASLMTAEEYYAGGRTEFNSEFENQMRSGIYLVKREEVNVKSGRSAIGSANIALGTDQEEYGEDDKTIFVVQKVLDATGQPRRKQQRFTDYGITVVSALVTDIKPNQKFIERMQLKQKASADRAIAREQRVQEEEQRLLAIARGEREVAERQAKAKVDQIQKTTEAQTEKQLAITRAEKLKAEAEIQRETAEINLEKARIEAETQRTLADAEAYQKQVILEADNALAQKLEAEIKIQQLWAEAYAKRKVPTNVFGSGSGSGAPVGNDYETKAFMQMLTLDAAKRLSYDRDMVKE